MAASLAALAASVALAAFVEKEDWFRERRQFSFTQKGWKRNFVTFFGQLIDRWTLMESVLVVT